MRVDSRQQLIIFFVFLFVCLYKAHSAPFHALWHQLLLLRFVSPTIHFLRSRRRKEVCLFPPIPSFILHIAFCCCRRHTNRHRFIDASIFEQNRAQNGRRRCSCYCFLSVTHTTDRQGAPVCEGFKEFCAVHHHHRLSEQKLSRRGA